MADSGAIRAMLEQETSYPAALTERCELLELLSQRSDCHTLLARERSSGRLLVVKCYEKVPEFDNDEADILRRLHCFGLPAFAGVCESEERYCVLRDYIPGETLDKVARRGLTEAKVREIGLKLCRILRYLHDQDPPVIHRDIKPQNIVITEEGGVCLIDFGISRRYCRGATSDTVISGTQDFAPPEQYGFSQTDCRSDIFSLGVLLNWLLTGSTHVEEGHGGGLMHCIRRCTAFDPKDRYQNVDALARALRLSAWRVSRLLLTGILLLALVMGMIALSLEIVSGDPGSLKLPDSGGVQEETAVSFQEPLIEEAVRLILGKGPDESISDQELEAVDEILIICGDVCIDANQFWTEGANEDTERLAEAGGGLRSLEDLRRMPNLRSLCVSGGSITDLSPLAGMT